MDNILQSVAKTWHRIQWALVVPVSAIITLGCVVAMYVPRYHHLIEGYAFTPSMLLFAAATLVYCLTFYFWGSRHNPTLAIFGVSVMLTFIPTIGLSSDNPIAYSLYVSLWFINLFFLGMYGGVLSVGCVFLAASTAFLSPDLSLAPLDLRHITLAVSSATAIIGGYFFWKDKFIDPAAAQLNQLAGILKNKDQQAAILIQSIADGVIVTNTERKISLMNRAAANMTGWAVDDAAGIDVQQVFKVAKEKGEEIPQDDYPFTAVLAHKAFYNQVLQLTSRTGKKQVVSLVISPVVTPKGEVFGAVAVLRDVSEERAAEHQRAEFISTASHEMRTPVAAIEGYLALALNDKVSTIDTRARSYLEKAHASTKHLGQLFQDLLTSAKAEDGRISNHPAVVEMGSFLDQLVEDLKFGAAKKGLSSEFIVGSSSSIDATNREATDIKVIRPLYYVYVDADRIREVITNLFDNGVKYTQQGKVSVGLTGNNDVVQLFIRDTGPGIPPEDLPHLFQKFYRVDNSATRTIGGTGLGLFICRKIVELYQGRIWVTSEMGRGSTFYINLPRLSAQKAQDLTTAAATLPAAPTMPTAPPAQAAPAAQPTPPAPAAALPQAQPTTPQQTAS